MTKSSGMLRACIAVAAMAVAGCSTPLANGPEQVFDVTDRFPVTVSPRMMTLRLPYNGQPALNPDATGQLARFAQDFVSRGSGSLAIAPPSSYPAAADLVIAQLVELGVGRNQIMVGAPNAPGPTEDIRLTYIRYVAETAPCGDWSTDVSHTAGNVPPPNFGCATQHNIAAMVSDPRDLLSPPVTGASEAQRSMTVLERYRDGLATPAIRPDALNAILSNVLGGN